MSGLLEGSRAIALLFPYIEKKLCLTDSFFEHSFLNPGENHLLEPFLQEQIIAEASSAPLFSLGGMLVQFLLEASSSGLMVQSLGKIGPDTAGRFYHSALEKANIKSLLMLNDFETSQALVINVPNHPETICHYLGASLELEVDDLEPTFFESRNILFLDANSMLWGCLPLKALEIARKQKIKTCFFLDALFKDLYSDDWLRIFLLKPIDLLVTTKARLNFFLKKQSLSKEKFLKEFTGSLLLEVPKGCELYKKGELVKFISYQEGISKSHLICNILQSLTCFS